MGRKYNQLCLEERCVLSRLHEDGKAIRQISAIMGRSPSTISRELKRNSGNKVGYKPAYADDTAWARRWRGSRLERKEALRETVLKHLAMGKGLWRLPSNNPFPVTEHFPFSLNQRQLSPHVLVMHFVSTSLVQPKAKTH